MTGPCRPRKYVLGPDGSPLTLADLPAPGTKRWVIRRKAEVVAAVRGGLLSLEEACSRYMLTVEEFLAWQRSIDRHGLAGLRTTRIQQYRPVVSDRDVPPAQRSAPPEIDNHHAERTLAGLDYLAVASPTQISPAIGPRSNSPRTRAKFTAIRRASSRVIAQRSGQ
jgi:hypothetical protein